MKKFLTVAIILGILGFGTYYAAMYKGFYIDFHPDTPAEASFTAEGKNSSGITGTKLRSL